MKKLCTLFLALTAGITMSLSAQSIIHVHDQSLEDWNNLPEEYVFESVCPSDASLQALKSVKVYADATVINVLIEPDLDLLPDCEWMPFHVFIDTDNSDATGGFADLFSDPNADILLESAIFANGQPYEYIPAVFKWWGEVGGSGWQWVDPDNEPTEANHWGAIIGEHELHVASSQFIDGKFEMQFYRTYIPAEWNDSVFGIGFEVSQSVTWTTAGVLPAASGINKAAKMKVRIDKREGTTVTVDRVVYELNTYAMTAEVCGFILCGEQPAIPAEITCNGIVYTVSGIKDYAFTGCPHLQSVICYATVPPIVDGSQLNGLNSSITIYVPDEALEAYQLHPVWGQYNILPLSSLNFDVDIVHSNSVSSLRKLIRDGQLLIIRGDHTYTPLGQEIE